MGKSERSSSPKFFDVLSLLHNTYRTRHKFHFLCLNLWSKLCVCLHLLRMTLKMFIFTFRKRDLSMVFWCIVMKWVFHNNFTIFSPFTHFCVFIFWYLKTRFGGQWWSSYCFKYWRKVFKFDKMKKCQWHKRYGSQTANQTVYLQKV